MRNGNGLIAEANGGTRLSCIKPDITKICKSAKRCLPFVVKNHISIKNLYLRCCYCYFKYVNKRFKTALV